MFSDNVGRFVIRYRYLLAAFVLLITAFFAYHAKNIELVANLSNMFPQNHPFVKTHNRFQDSFGGANLMLIMVAVKEGDIFNQDTLGKIYRITDELQYIPGVNRTKIFSIGARKVKNISVTDWGLTAKPLMEEVPGTEENLAYLRKAIYSNDMVYGSLVSLDDKAALIVADL